MSIIKIKIKFIQRINFLLHFNHNIYTRKFVMAQVSFDSVDLPRIPSSTYFGKTIFDLAPKSV